MKKIFCSLLLCLFTACSTMQIPEPGVSLADLKLNNISFFETSLTGAVRIQNNSSKALKIIGSEHELIINNTKIGVARSDEELSIPAYGDSLQKFSLTASNIKLLTRLEGMINSKNFSYKINSKIYLPGLLLNRTLETTAEGSY